MADPSKLSALRACGWCGVVTINNVGSDGLADDVRRPKGLGRDGPRAVPCHSRALGKIVSTHPRYLRHLSMYSQDAR